MERIDAPWTSEQVRNLEKRQADCLLHPYTSGSGSGSPLIPTPEGWREVPDGPIVQTWALACDLDLQSGSGGSAFELLEQIVSDHEELPSGPEVKVGDWFWVSNQARDDLDEELSPGNSCWFGCIVHVGSNYYKLRGLRPSAGGGSLSDRIHFDEFAFRCRKEPDPQRVVRENVEQARAESADLLGKVKELTARLGVSPNLSLGPGSETQALVLSTGNQSGDAYEKSLVKAKKETLPSLFAEIREVNEKMATWMSAEVIPLEAQAEGLNRLIEVIDDRILNVQLYAGLVEKIVRVTNGMPAPVGEKIRLMQRMCFMDEECVANYEHGGMSFEDMKAFDCWVARRDNRDRMFPFPRCVVALRVRRDPKNRPPPRDLAGFFSIQKEAELDKLTFLYVRNGDRLYRISTAMDFDEKLFPDVDREMLSGRLWAKDNRFDPKNLISDNQYREMKEEHALAMREWRAKMARKKVDKAAGKKVEPGGPWDREPRDPTEGYSAYDRDNVYYDDISRGIQRKIHKHNRTVVIIQGLLDRSPVFQPHPGWQIWKSDGFQAGVELILDDSMALVAGDKPDFEAYRARLNDSIRSGTVTIGQERYWLQVEARKESDRMDRNWRYSRTDRRPTLWRPYGDPGPGKFARVLRVSGDSCHYEWQRKRRPNAHGRDDLIRRTVAVPRKALLNVDAYSPGDYKIFFNDPRTRSEYLRWAPLLLEAEEYHVGNRKVGPRERDEWDGGDRSYSEGDDDL